MENKTTFIASGCSFTFEDWNWPSYLTKHMNWDLVNVGMASSGNGLISKKVIYNVNRLLKIKSPEDIKVGIMWSGVDRYEFYIDDGYEFENKDTSVRNPTNVVNDKYNWIMTNAHWKNNKYADIWYGNLHTNIGSMIFTIENILRVQWYLETLNIKYFMTTYMDIFNPNVNYILYNPDVRYLYDMINFDKFLPIRGVYEWVKDNYIDGGFNPPDNNGIVGIHPTPYGHSKLVSDVIIPYVERNF